MRTRVDFVIRDRGTGQIEPMEGKSSETARLTRNQRLTHPEFEMSGGTIKGKGKPIFEGGMEIPPTTVKIIRDP